MSLFMVVETYRRGKAQALYQRFAEKGRMLPDGVRYVDSWIDHDVTRCFQLMEADDPSLLREWTSRWDDLVEFEIIPVLTSAEASERAREKPAAG